MTQQTAARWTERALCSNSHLYLSGSWVAVVWPHGYVTSMAYPAAGLAPWSLNLGLFASLYWVWHTPAAWSSRDVPGEAATGRRG